MRRLPFLDQVRLAQIDFVLDLIETGGPFPYRKDGRVYKNLDGRLPVLIHGYYHEYTVATPGVSGGGIRRIIIGQNSETYYSDDHYESFVRISARRYP